MCEQHPERHVAYAVHHRGIVNVPSLEAFEALARRVQVLEARAGQQASEWIPVARSPLGSRKTRRLVAAGKLEASRVGRLLYVRAADVDRFLERRIVTRPKPVPVPVATDDAAEYARANLHLLMGGANR